MAARANTISQRESLRIAQARFDAGLVSLLDVEQARSNLADTEALRQAIDDLDAIDGNVVLTEGAGETRYDVTIVKPLDGSVDLDVSTEFLGGTIDLEGFLDLMATVNVNFAFGIDSAW